MSGTPQFGRAYLISIRRWNPTEVHNAMQTMDWWDAWSDPIPRGAETLLVLVNDPLECPPQGLFNLQEIKRKNLVRGAKEFAAQHPDLSVEFVEPLKVESMLSGIDEVRYHMASL